MKLHEARKNAAELRRMDKERGLDSTLEEVDVSESEGEATEDDEAKSGTEYSSAASEPELEPDHMPGDLRNGPASDAGDGSEPDEDKDDDDDDFISNPKNRPLPRTKPKPKAQAVESESDDALSDASDDSD